MASNGTSIHDSAAPPEGQQHAQGALSPILRTIIASHLARVEIEKAMREKEAVQWLA